MKAYILLLWYRKEKFKSWFRSINLLSEDYKHIDHKRRVLKKIIQREEHISFCEQAKCVRKQAKKWWQNKQKVILNRVEGLCQLATESETT
jgi:hypothetical protein